MSRKAAHISGTSAGLAGTSLHIVSYPPVGYLRLVLTMAEGFPVAREGKHQYVSTFEASDCILFINVPLAKASHVAQPGLSVGRHHLKA